MPTTKEIRQAFLQEYRGKRNLFTPYIHGFGYSLKNPSLFFELSYGSGILSKWMIGVTVLEMPESIQRHDLSMCFPGDNKSELLTTAKEYGESLMTESKEVDVRDFVVDNGLIGFTEG